MNPLSEIRKDAAGAALLADWLGHGLDVVPMTVARQRAQTCLDNHCQENRAPRWWETLQNTIALTIRRQLEIKNKLDLRLSTEEHLHMCRKCGCCLKLKVWVPFDHIRSHLHPTLADTFPNYCWIKKEFNELLFSR